ncbi:hypothetical protein SAMN05428952_102621 [Nitrosomonas sp. Nm132]|jgi:hypothetical protein|nr:hypothetical protein SAMN05428952_102621 [Nitrosomonas sp. Nm132]
MEYPFGVAAFVPLAFTVGSDPKPEQHFPSDPATLHVK